MSKQTKNESEDKKQTSKSKDEPEMGTALHMDKNAYRDLMRKQVRNGLLISSFPQIIVSALFIALPYVLLMIQIDALYPINLEKIPILWGIGYSLGSITCLTLICALIYHKIDQTKFGYIFGHIVGGLMMVFVPYGPFYGSLLIQDVRDPLPDRIKNGEREKRTRDKELREFVSTFSKQLILFGAISMGLPFFFLWLKKFAITQQIDLAYPMLSSKDIIALNWFGVAYFIIFAFQMVVGSYYRFGYKKKGMKATIIVLALFQIFSLAILIQVFISNNFPAILEDQGSEIPIWTLNFAWILGVMLNPIGMYFGIYMLRNLKIINKTISNPKIISI